MNASPRMQRIMVISMFFQLCLPVRVHAASEGYSGNNLAGAIIGSLVIGACAAGGSVYAYLSHKNSNVEVIKKEKGLLDEVEVALSLLHRHYPWLNAQASSTEAVRTALSHKVADPQAVEAYGLEIAAVLTVISTRLNDLRSISGSACEIEAERAILLQQKKAALVTLQELQKLCAVHDNEYKFFQQQRQRPLAFLAVANASMHKFLSSLQNQKDYALVQAIEKAFSGEATTHQMMGEPFIVCTQKSYVILEHIRALVKILSQQPYRDAEVLQKLEEARAAEGQLLALVAKIEALEDYKLATKRYQEKLAAVESARARMKLAEARELQERTKLTQARTAEHQAATEHQQAVNRGKALVVEGLYFANQLAHDECQKIDRQLRDRIAYLEDRLSALHASYTQEIIGQRIEQDQEKQKIVSEKQKLVAEQGQLTQDLLSQGTQALEALQQDIARLKSEGEALKQDNASLQSQNIAEHRRIKELRSVGKRLISYLRSHALVFQNAEGFEYNNFMQMVQEFEKLAE